MFLVFLYGCLVVCVVFGGFLQIDFRVGGGGGGDYGLVIVGCGFGKDFCKGFFKKGVCYGDDVCFVV